MKIVKAKKKGKFITVHLETPEESKMMLHLQGCFHNSKDCMMLSEIADFRKQLRIGLYDAGARAL